MTIRVARKDVWHLGRGVERFSKLGKVVFLIENTGWPFMSSFPLFVYSWFGQKEIPCGIALLFFHHKTCWWESGSHGHMPNS